MIDPPWEYGEEYHPETRRAASPYPEMSLEKIKEIQPPAKDDCILWMWTTHRFMRDAFDIMKHWGFEYKLILTWDKEYMGLGQWLRKQCEFCLLGIKGHPVFEGKDTRDIIREQRTTHSTKPEIFYKIVDKICVGRKLDYFARKKRDGWEVFGDEVTGLESKGLGA